MFGKHSTTLRMGITLFIVAGALLAGCAGAPTPTPVPPAPATPAPATPAPTTVKPAAPATAAAYQPYVNLEGNFSLSLPAGWVVSSPEQTPQGESLYRLGPSPLPPAPASSAIVVSTLFEGAREATIKQLCGSGCAQTPQVEEVNVNGLMARRAKIGAPALEWYFFELGDKFIYLSIHDPQTLQSLEEVIATFSQGGAAQENPEKVPAGQVARDALARQLKLDPSAITIVAADSIEWPDTCLGQPAEGETCANVVTPGYLGLLEIAGGQMYEFHSNADGSAVRFIPAAALGARQILMEHLLYDYERIKLISFEETQWPNACLGVPQESRDCGQTAMRGYKVVFEAEGQRYEYHTDYLGYDFVLAAGPQPDVKDAAVTWKLQGERCETAAISSQVVAFGPCGAPQMGGKFMYEERPQDFAYLMQTYAPFEATTPAGVVAFKGQGTTVASEVEQRMIAEWAWLVYAEAAGATSMTSPGPAFVWHREGGIAGFCDDLSVYPDGNYYAVSCKGGEQKFLGSGRLSVAQLTQVFSWLDQFQGFDDSTKDEAKADAMTLELSFAGRGATAAGDADKQAMQALATELFEKAQ